MRISDQAAQLNITYKPCEDRPDKPPGAVVYRVKEIFTTRDGSWEPSSQPGSIPQWARDAYLRPWGAPDYFDDAGADHHLFARVLDVNGQPIKTQDLIICWSDGFQLLAQPNFADAIKMTMTPKEGSGWANQPIWNSYVPERNERGAWCWCPRGAADVVIGGGLPSNWHVSTFAVWQAEPRQDGAQPDGHGNVGGELPPPPALDALRSAVWLAAGIASDPASAFVAYGRAQQLGAPLTNVIDGPGYRAQGFANGIVYALLGQGPQLNHIPW